MNTLEFLTQILPDSGNYILVEFRGGVIKKQHYLDTIQETADMVKVLDKRGADVYHACASFLEKGNRKQVNVDKLKSLFLDIDVGDNKDYKSLEEALLDLKNACSAIDLPIPIIISSGKGLHCYWTFDTAVTGARWKACANNLRKALDFLEFHHDASRTTDQASILRPVGSTWRKDGSRPVRAAYTKYVPKSFDFFDEKLKVFLSGNDIELDSPIEKVHNPVFDIFSDSPAMVAKKDYPPSSGEKIADQCMQVQRMRELKGVLPEPEWRNSIGLLKHTTNGEKLCHDWSSGDPRYSKSATQAKIDGWVTGPTTCETFERTMPHGCVGCKFKGSITSPIQLGYSEDASAPQALGSISESSESHIDYEKFWPKNFQWNEKRSELSILVKNDKGIKEWLPFSDTLFYPTTRVELDDSTWAQRINMVLPNEKVRTFDVPTKLLAKPDLLSAFLASNEIIIHHKREYFAVAYLTNYLRKYKQASIEMKLFKKFGWVEDGFLLGSTLITDKEVKKVALNEDLNDKFGLMKAHEEGNPQEWARIFDIIYNRKGAEPYQFAALAMLSSPIVGLINDEMWKGIPVAFTGEGGQGKTSLGLITCSAFTEPTSLIWNAGAATDNAIDAIVGTLNHLPVVLDELTGRQAFSVADKLMALSIGQSRTRSKQTGELSNIAWTWGTNAFITGNTNLTQSLAELEQTRAEASMARVFEVTFGKGEMETIFGEVNFKDLQHELITKHAGAIGVPYLRHLMQYKDKITEKFHSMRAVTSGSIEDYESRERYYNDLINTAEIAGNILSSLGFIRFDIKAAIDWAKRHVVHLRETRADNILTAGDLLAKFLSEISISIVVTKSFNRSKQESPLSSFPTPRQIKARMATTDRRLLVSLSGFNSWCKENAVSPATLRKDLLKSGYLKDNTTPVTSLTTGCNIPSARQRVLELSYDATMGVVGVKDGKIINLKREGAE